jgi:hypothetical protein
MITQERKDFEAWASKRFSITPAGIVEMRHYDSYESQMLARAWESWQARGQQDQSAEVAELYKLRERLEAVDRVLLCGSSDAAIVSGAAKLIVSCARKMFATGTRIELLGMTEGDVAVGDWVVSVERIKAP